MSNVDCVEHGSCVRRAIAAIAVSGTDAVAPIRGIDTMTPWSTASDHHQLPNLSPQRKKEKTVEALIHQLEGLARQQPIAIVFEDAHWIDPTSRELLDLTIDPVRNLPVLLIVSFRPEFQPPWTAQVTILALNRLDRNDRTTLIEQIAGSSALASRRASSRRAD